MASILPVRRAYSSEKLNELRALLEAARTHAEGCACVYVTGSFARGEATKSSDLDLFIAGLADDKGNRQLSRLNEICIKADLISATRRLAIPEFSGDGEYLSHYTVEQLVKSLGSQENDAKNTFTARLLLLLESRPLVNNTIYSQVISDVVSAYWRDFEDHKNDFEPFFLCNDILRLWRTFCVNYEARTTVENAEKKANRKLKNYKLKHSRLLTCYSAIAYLLALVTQKKTVTPDDALAMSGLTPTGRLEWISNHIGLPVAQGSISELIALYERFLDQTAGGEDALLTKFRDAFDGRFLLVQAGEFGEKMHGLLFEIGIGQRLYRLLIV